MPVRYPDEFRQRAIELARAGDKPVARLAADLGIAPSCLRRWMKQDDIDRGRRDGLDTDERAELVRLRRELRTAQMENEILRRAAVVFRLYVTLPLPGGLARYFAARLRSWLFLVVPPTGHATGRPE